MTLDDLEFTDNLTWPDEFRYNQVEQTQERSLTGGLIIQEGQKLYGRPITLEGWLSRGTIDALFALEAEPGKIMTLTLGDGRAFSVVFDRSRGQAIEAQQVLQYTLASQDEAWPYIATLRFLTVEPPAEED